MLGPPAVPTMPKHCLLGSPGLSVQGDPPAQAWARDFSGLQDPRAKEPGNRGQRRDRRRRDDPTRLPLARRRQGDGPRPFWLRRPRPLRLLTWRRMQVSSPTRTSDSVPHVDALVFEKTWRGEPRRCWRPEPDGDEWSGGLPAPTDRRRRVVAWSPASAGRPGPFGSGGGGAVGVRDGAGRRGRRRRRLRPSACLPRRGARAMWWPVCA